MGSQMTGTTLTSRIGGLLVASAVGMNFLGAQLRRNTDHDPPGSELAVNGAPILAPVVTISNSGDLLVDSASHRVVQLDLVRRSAKSTSYPMIPISANPVDGCVGRGQTVALLDSSSNPGILELSRGGQLTRIPISGIAGTLFSLAAWEDGTYLVAPSSSRELVYHISGQGKVLRSFGKSQYFTDPGKFRLGNHSRVYSTSDFAAIYTVDTLAGIVTVWDKQFAQVSSLTLPRHPHAAEIHDFIAKHVGDPHEHLLTVEIYGIPVMVSRLLVFPGISYSPPGELVHKTLFALDTSQKRLLTYTPIVGIGGQVVSDGMRGVLVDARLGGSARFHYFELKL